MADVNLSTPYSFTPSIMLPEIFRQVQGADFEVLRLHAHSSMHIELTARDPDGSDIRLTVTQLPQSQQSKVVEGVPVAGKVDCLNRTLQALCGREEAKDYVDVAALEKSFTPARFDEITADLLAAEARRARVEPYKPHLALYNRLAMIVRQSHRSLESLAPEGWSAEDVSSRVIEMTARVLANAPEPPLEPGQQPPRALLDATHAQLSALRLALVVAEFDSRFEGEVALPPHWGRLAEFVGKLSQRQQLEPESTRVEAELARRPHPQPPLAPATHPQGRSPR
ncbi:hypothetical protein [Streptomyces botrytidirepellens]|uniref:hypothetical protein n=1 Tax=Streptomyces botrytidirepellens TaxID=2486417 RepID=UPI0011CE9AFD|nr:hypothetical protein [Streptomyces botrytidirepellens]